MEMSGGNRCKYQYIQFYENCQKSSTTGPPAPFFLFIYNFMCRRSSETCQQLKSIIKSTSMNRNSELRKLPAKSTVELANILEEMQAWKVLMSAIKRDDNSSKYSLTQIKNVESYSCSTKKPAAEVLFDEWGTSGRQRPTLGTLLALLVDCELFRAADYLAINILGEPPVRRPRSTPSPPPESDISDATEDTSPQLVPYLDLESACHWQDGEAKLLGSGAFGSVFLGHLPQLNHKPVAVKKLQTDVTSNDKQFFTELNALSRYRHANLVQLLGYSCDGPCYCLIYEFMSNGSLQDRLACLDSPFVENPTSEPLKYELRLRIADDVARGLVYLHTAGESPLIHRDVKSANILLGTNFTAKLGDFGLVRLSGDHNPNNSGSVSGTAGTSAYMAPEALQSGEITVLCDTFSYGVVLMEILTSLAPIDETRECWDLINHLKIECGDGPINPLLDMRAGDWGGPEHPHAHSLFHIANECLNDKDYRPTMVQVLTQIELIVV